MSEVRLKDLVVDQTKATPLETNQRFRPASVADLVAALLNEGRVKQVGWYAPGSKRFCYTDEKRAFGPHRATYTEPVYVVPLEDE